MVGPSGWVLYNILALGFSIAAENLDKRIGGG